MTLIEEKLFELLNNILKFQLCLLTKENSFDCFISSSSFDISLWFMIIIILYSFIWSIIGQNCSKVDQIWSITPWLYMWIFNLHYYTLYGIFHKRCLLVTLLSTLWGIRLTYNFWRRGGYGTFIVHEEDYRWPIIRSKMHPIIFFFFNLTFIATYQNILLWLIATPVYIISQYNSNTINIWDIILSITYLTLLLIETIADQQQYNFQEYKHSLTIEQRKNHKSEDIRNGFLRTGLFKYCRHPNYFAEQSIWVCVYLFSITSVNSFDLNNLYNWSIYGCILLILLFQGSTAFSESITAEKYPAYKLYQKEVSQTIPWFPKPSNKIKYTPPPTTTTTTPSKKLS